MERPKHIDFGFKFSEFKISKLYEKNKQYLCTIAQKDNARFICFDTSDLEKFKLSNFERILVTTVSELQMNMESLYDKYENTPKENDVTRAIKLFDLAKTKVKENDKTYIFVHMDTIVVIIDTLGGLLNVYDTSSTGGLFALSIITKLKFDYLFSTYYSYTNIKDTLFVEDFYNI